MNPLNEQLEAAHITMQVDVSISLNVDSDFKVTGVMDEDSAKLTVQSVKALFKSDETAESLQEKVNVLSSLLIKGVNSQLETGIVLPVPENISELIVTPFIEIRDHFIVI